MTHHYLDPATPRRIDGWHSPSLGQDMPIVSYGDRGPALLLFPTAAADFLENERFYLVKSVEPFIQQGRLRLFSIDSIYRQAWMDRTLPVAEQARRQALYARYVEDEVVPHIRGVCGGHARIGTTGASFGAFHAANTLFRRPDLFDTLIATASSGSFSTPRPYSLTTTLGVNTSRWKGAGVGVAVIDSGIVASRDFDAADGTRITGFWDFTSGGAAAAPKDGFGHGTHVAGLIAGNGTTTGAYRGVAPAARINSTGSRTEVPAVMTSSTMITRPASALPTITPPSP